MTLPAKTVEASTWEETLFQNLYRLIQARESIRTTTNS
jgi:hypothetical protein